MFLSTKTIFFNTTEDLLKGLSQGTQTQTELFIKLDEFSVESINYVSQRLKYSHEQIGVVKSMLIGTIEKVGFIPGVAATLLALHQTKEITGFSFFDGLSIGLMLFYFMFFKLMSAALTFKNFAFILEQYIKLQEHKV